MEDGFLLEKIFLLSMSLGFGRTMFYNTYRTKFTRAINVGVWALSTAAFAGIMGWLS